MPRPPCWPAKRELSYERGTPVEREFIIDNPLVRIHRCFLWTGLAPWEFESPFPGSLISTFLGFPENLIGNKRPYTLKPRTQTPNLRLCASSSQAASSVTSSPESLYPYPILGLAFDHLPRSGGPEYHLPPWRQSRGKSKVNFLSQSPTDATRFWWYLRGS